MPLCARIVFSDVFDISASSCCVTIQPRSWLALYSRPQRIRAGDVQSSSQHPLPSPLTRVLDAEPHLVHSVRLQAGKNVLGLWNRCRKFEFDIHHRIRTLEP